MLHTTSAHGKKRHGRARPRVVHITTVHHLRDPRIFSKQVQSLRAGGYDVHLVAPHARSETVEGISVAALSPGRGLAHRLVLQWEAYRAARALQADLYHIHDPELIPVAYALKRRTGARVIYDMHEDYTARGVLRARVLRSLERWGFTWADHVVVANEPHLRFVTGAPATWIGNYFKPPEGYRAPAPRPLPDEGLRLLYTGVMSDTRGLPELLDVAGAILRRKLPWRIDLVGVCYLEADRQRAAQRIAEERMETVVYRQGWDYYVPWGDMVPYYEQAHVGLILWAPSPNHGTNIPTKFYEYLNYGLPILCADYPLWRAFVEDHACGVAVGRQDAAGIVALLQRWRQAPEEYTRLVEGALAAAPEYRWAVMEARLLALYASLLA